ncbi:hypothetical protein DNTS_028652, partial [Danionella cerebrum]
KIIKVRIIDDEEYEKNKSFFLEIGEPQLVETNENRERTHNLTETHKHPVLWIIVIGINYRLNSTFSSPPALAHATVEKERMDSIQRFLFLSESLLRYFNSSFDFWPESQPAFGKLIVVKFCLRHEEEKEAVKEEEEPLTGEEEEERRIAEMGKPMLGDHPKLENTVDKLIKKTNLALLVGTNSWRDQFIEAITVSAGEDDDEEECGEEKLPSCFDYVMHFLTVFWKVLFAFVPPTDYWNGWACFVVSILMIGLLTAFIGDLASHFGCTVGLKDSVTAVVFVALGTSVPDTFASKVAAIQDQYADASIGNVTGSNAVNVFLGIGVAWSIAAIYHNSKGQPFKVEPGNLAFSVTLFTIFAFICVAVLMYRRRPDIGGELGGPRTAKALTTMLFVSLWLIYILFSSLEAYCHIKGF